MKNAKKESYETNIENVQKYGINIHMYTGKK